MIAMWAWHAHGLKFKCLHDAERISENNYLGAFNELLIYLLLHVLEIDEELYIFF